MKFADCPIILKIRTTFLLMMKDTTQNAQGFTSYSRYKYTERMTDDSSY